MNSFITSLFHICLFRSKPQDLPASKGSLKLAVIGASIVFIVRNSLLTGVGNSVFVAIVQIVLLGAILWLLLRLFHKSDRWLQSATAFYGCSAIVVAVVIPFLLTSDSNTFTQDGLSLAKMAVFISSIWYFSILVFIIKETLETNVVLAFIITLVLELTLASILLKIFGNGLL
jgi:hypothetical protein